MLLVIFICWLAGFALLWKVPTCGDDGEKSPALRAAAKPGVAGDAFDRLAIIIPARNEELALPRLLASIAAQDARPAEITVVDDDSSDATASVSRAAGVTVISAEILPDGWRGKTWACQQGAAKVAADHLLFLDADTWFETGGLRRIAQSYTQKPGVLSVLPYHVVPTAVEQLSAFFNIIMAASIGGFGLLNRQPNGLFGQVLLIDRQTYLSVEGHERVRQQVLENVHLAAHLRSAGVMLRCFSGRGTLSMRMYPGGLRDIIQGWTKGFASGAGATPRPILALTILWLSGAMMAAAGLRVHHPGSIAVYLLFVGQLFFMLRRLGTFWFTTALLYPIPLIFFFLLFAKSTLHSGRTVTWKGRAFNAG